MFLLCLFETMKDNYHYSFKYYCRIYVENGSAFPAKRLVKLCLPEPCCFLAILRRKCPAAFVIYLSDQVLFVSSIATLITSLNIMNMFYNLLYIEYFVNIISNYLNVRDYLFQCHIIICLHNQWTMVFPFHAVTGQVRAYSSSF